MSIMEYNGSGLVAMAGKNCVGIASDTRFGVQQQTISTDMERVFAANNSTLYGLSGLATDVKTLSAKMSKIHNLYRLREGRDMSPRVFNSVMESTLYKKRFGPYFVEPLIAGLEPSSSPSSSSSSTSDTDKEKSTLKPFIAGQDLLGASVFVDDFAVVGTAESSLYGTAEAFYKPNLEPDDLFEVLAQTLIAAVDRDCLSGWGGVVHILTPEKHIVKRLKGRHD